MKTKLLILSLLLVSCSLTGFSQWNGNWRDHLSYRECNLVAENEKYAVAATETGLILYNFDSKETQKLSIVSGLSDVGISAIAAIGDDGFLVGYDNGNIDVISDNKIINIPDLKNKQIQGSKRINHFITSNNKVYCSSDLGILVINLDKMEIADTYYLGINSANLIIHECAIKANIIYAATERGLLQADLNDPQIAYYESWRNIGNSSIAHIAISTFQNFLITVRKNGSNPYEVLYGVEDNWNSLKNTNKFKNLSADANDFIIVESNIINKYDSSFKITETIDEYIIENQDTLTLNIGQAIFSNPKNLYLIADYTNSLVINEKGNANFIIPNGPYSNNAFKLHATSQGIYSLAGGLTTAYNNINQKAEFSFFDNEVWTYYRTEQRDDKYLWRDLIRICSDRNDERIVYMSSWGGGIFITENTTILNHYNQYNSSLQNIFPNGNQNFVRVGGIATDSEGNVWMSNGEVEYGMVIREAADTSKWHQFSYESMQNLHSTDQILITKDDYVWIIIPRTDQQGILVIDPRNTLLDQTDDQYKGARLPSAENDPRNAGQLRIWDESLNVITSKVFCLAEDKNGYIWLGTDKGVVVYYRPWSIFNEDYPAASRIKVPRNDGSNQADYLLEKEQVTSIAIDGANRKWIGTQSSGIYLVSDDGITTYETFNTENSPLPSNYINSIAIDPVSGEVFIGTSKGIVSYKGKATEGAENLNKVYAYPNPVRESFNGDITITGLLQDSNVKITSVSGKLVHETRSLGGKAYWNGKNLQGEKVKSGIYIVYISSEDGLKVETTKIMIVR